MHRIPECRAFNEIIRSSAWHIRPSSKTPAAISVRTGTFGATQWGTPHRQCDLKGLQTTSKNPGPGGGEGEGEQEVGEQNSSEQQFCLRGAPLPARGRGPFGRKRPRGNPGCAPRDIQRPLSPLPGSAIWVPAPCGVWGRGEGCLGLCPRGCRPRRPWTSPMTSSHEMRRGAGSPPPETPGKAVLGVPGAGGGVRGKAASHGFLESKPSEAAAIPQSGLFSFPGFMLHRGAGGG